ncbi:unnamed protein product [Blepharisma stoltei]|uniref:Acyltransferase 3 domain-containing protein n=1 Tax=Blepharisma stoltei TaxID=1481888 RepID=A0AAU9J840_9CILI|nr:unnamed protein product [Blepharisma stoltei]
MYFHFILLFLGAVWAQSTLLQCKGEWIKILESAKGIIGPSPSDYSKQFLYTGLNANELGQYDSCLELDNSKFTLIQASDSPIIAWGLCGPSICSEADYYLLLQSLADPEEKNEEILKTSFSKIVQASALGSLKIVFPKEYIDDHFNKYSSGETIMFTITIVIISTAAIGTGIDYWIYTQKEAKKDQEALNFLLKLFLCFSVITNFKKIFKSRSEEKFGEKNTFEILNSVRVLAIGWVIFGQFVNIISSNAALVNFNKLITIAKLTIMIFPLTSTLAVDTFLWLSGFLLGYLLLVEINKEEKKMSWILLYIHRLFRLWPLMLFILFFFWAFQKHIGNGPLWYNGDLYNNDCKDYWWSSMLFINNFVPNWKGSGCLGQGWYLAMDMQFFIITPPIIYLYHKYNKYIGWAIMVFFIGLTIIISAVVAHHFTLNIVVPALPNENNYMDYYFTKPYCRIGAYAIGVLSAFIVYSYKQFKENGTKYDPIGVWIGLKLENRRIRWTVGFIGYALINFIIFIQYDAFKNPGGMELTYPNWTDEENQAFIALHRVVFTFALASLLLPALLGHFSWMTRFLSSQIWTPFSRLTFCVFLLQQNMIEIAYRSQRAALWFDQFSGIKDLTWFFLFLFVCSIPFVMLVEIPAFEIEKLIFKSKSQIVVEEKKSLLMISLVEQEKKPYYA